MNKLDEISFSNISTTRKISGSFHTLHLLDHVLFTSLHPSSEAPNQEARGPGSICLRNFKFWRSLRKQPI